MLTFTIKCNKIFNGSEVIRIGFQSVSERKGGKDRMSVSVTIDWKFVAAFGGSLVGFVLASKISADSAERVLTHFANSRPDIPCDC